MKKILLYLTVSLALALWFSSCSGEKEFNTEFLYSGGGRWYCEQYPLGNQTYEAYETYNADGTGKSWVLEGDVSEDEADIIEKWTLSGETLTLKIDIHMGGITYGTFKVSELTSSRMVYTSGNKTYTWRKL